MNNRNIESTVRAFFKEFFPRKEEENVDSIVQEVIAKEYTKRQVLEYLYKLKIESRFITLDTQRSEGIYYPTQRTTAWFQERKRIPSTVSGSRPAGWWFDITNPDAYKNHLGYVHEGKKQKFDKEAIARMNYGTKFENHALITFLEWGVSKLCSDMYIYETGFQRNTKFNYLGASPDGLVTEFFAGIILGSRSSLKYKNEKDHLMQYIDTDGESRTLIIEGNACLRAALAATLDQKEEKQVGKIDIMETPSGWTQCRYYASKAKAAKHSILEIKCPQKMYSNIPAYYLMQLHMECHAYGLQDAYFVVWNHLNQKERLRVWKFKFNAGFWTSFLTLVDTFRSRRSDGTRGAPWANFEQVMWHFKKNYGRVSTWHPFVKAYHGRGEFAVNRPYENALNKVPADAAQ